MNNILPQKKKILVFVFKGEFYYLLIILFIYLFILTPSQEAFLKFVGEKK
jgi:hypothetical protein